jgi:ribosome-associated protein
MTGTSWLPWAAQRAGGVAAGTAEGVWVSASAQALEMAKTAAGGAANKKAREILVIDVSEQLAITDCFVIASAANERQVSAIVDEVEERLRLAGHKPIRREGAREGRWVLLDYEDIVVHIQHAEERGFYGLDRLWKDCPRIEVPEAQVEPDEDDEAADG